jgi:hypothetical protein
MYKGKGGQAEIFFLHYRRYMPICAMWFGWLCQKPEDELYITILKSIFIRTRVGANGRRREPLTGNIPDWQRNNSSVVVQRSEIQRQLAKATEALPKKERLVLSLYYLGMIQNRRSRGKLGNQRSRHITIAHQGEAKDSKQSQAMNS